MEGGSENRLFDQMCRLCLKNDDSLLDIFSCSDADSIPLLQKISSCAAVDIFEGDGLPKQVCNECVTAVSQSYALRVVIEQADLRLRELVLTIHGVQTEPPDTSQEHYEETDVKVESEDESTAIDFLKLEVTSPDKKVELVHSDWEEEDLQPLFSIKKTTPKKAQKISRRKPPIILCPLCQKDVPRRKFKLHMMVHNGEKPHLCDICGKGFTWKHAMETHKRVHTGEKPYLCKHCGLSFRSSSRFAEHSTLHTGRRAYVCERCAMSFRTSGRLKRHMRIHTGEKPYKCSFCERCFSESYNLKQHLRLHTGEKPPHVCIKCGIGFARKKPLVDHLKMAHGITSLPTSPHPPTPTPTPAPVINININVQNSFVKEQKV